MSVDDTYDGPRCIVCDDPAVQQECWVTIFGRVLYFCPTDYILMKQLFSNGRGIVSGLRKFGINIGVPQQGAKNQAHVQKDKQ